MKISLKEFRNIPKEQRDGIYEVEYEGTFYYVNGKYHREDGPACEYNYGNKYWFINDRLHRLDGPACEWYDNIKFYYIEGKQYDTKEEFEAATYMYLNGLQDYL